MDKAIMIAEAVANKGGRAFIVGGYVRDQILGKESKDIDIEVFNLDMESLKGALSPFGEVDEQGKAFGVLRVRAFPGIDISLPRVDNKSGEGHKGFDVSVDPFMAPVEAAMRRDFTINAMSVDILSGEMIDPFGGKKDLEDRILRALPKFAEDPLRAMRGIQFAARFNLSVEEKTKDIMSSMDLASLPGERIFEEFNKLLLKSEKPSIGLHLMEELGMFRFFPEIRAILSVPQDNIYHPEGDVFTHTCMVVDEASLLKNGDSEHDMKLMYGTLCHDFGKPSTTEKVDGRIKSHGHEEAGKEPTRSFLSRFHAMNTQTIEAVVFMVGAHLAPAMLPIQGASKGAYRRLARNLFENNASPALLYKIGKADHFGRTTEDAIARDYKHGDKFMETMNEINVANKPVESVVLGRHLIQFLNMKPGKAFKEILNKCRDFQDETGSTDAREILESVVGKF